MRTLTNILSMTLVLSAVSCDKSEDLPAEEPAAVEVFGACTYTNPFSGGDECKEYTGAEWSDLRAEEDCKQPLVGAGEGTLEIGGRCEYPSVLGTCVINEGDGEESVLVFPGDDPSDCSGVSIGCGFGGGTFQPSAVCDETDAPPPSNGLPVFQPFEQVCKTPLPGEPAGQSADGEVCTWEAISACTEEGRKWVDYASCDAVISQRPYVPYTQTTPDVTGDARLDDAAYMNDMEWLTEQVESCACVCCHSSEDSPDGPSGWYVEAGPLWIDMLDDDALAMMAGWVNSESFGAFPPEDNNGFDRTVTGVPTNDVDRMVNFLEGELARRGLGRADFEEVPPFGGPLYDQLIYEPSPCTSGEGVDTDGTVNWTTGRARYVYVLEADADAPGVPPNRDLPDGTIWRIDVSPDADALADGFTYGDVPEGARQAFPTEGAPRELTVGETYYMYALADIYQPLTRCTFTYGG